MRNLRRSRWIPALALSSLAACSTTSERGTPVATAAQESATGAEKEGREKALKRATLERELPIARQKVGKAQRDLEDQNRSGEAAVAKARGELELAVARLSTFEQREAPNRLAKADLDLRQAKDGLEDAREELQQIEMMYEEQDLADKTREIVIRRSQRALARAERRFEIQEKERQTLEGNTLPQERQKLALEVEEKRRELERAERSAATGALEKRIALLSAEADVARVESELASLAEGSPAKASVR